MPRGVYDRKPYTGPRYPLEALERLIPTAPQRALGLSGQQMATYRAEGLTEAQADRLAVRAGFLPFEVWPEMVEHAAHESLRECADVECSVTFVPNAGNRRQGGSPQRFCSPRCRQRARRRRPDVQEARKLERLLYETPEAAELRRRRVALYHDTYRDRINAARRAKRSAA